MFVISEKYVVLRWVHVYTFWFIPICKLGKFKRAGIRGTLQTWKGRDCLSRWLDRKRGVPGDNGVATTSMAIDRAAILYPQTLTSQTSPAELAVLPSSSITDTHHYHSSPSFHLGTIGHHVSSTSCRGLSIRFR